VTEQADIHDVIALAWADEVSFEDIKRQTGLAESEVIALMRRQLKTGSYRTWRKRVNGRTAKHAARMRPGPFKR